MAVAIINISSKGILFANDDFRDLLGESSISLQEFAEAVSDSATPDQIDLSCLSAMVLDRLGSRLDGETTRLEKVTYLSLGREMGSECVMAVESHDAVVDAAEPRSLTQSYLALAMQSSGIGAWSLNLKTQEAERTPSHDAIFGYDGEAPRWDFNVFMSHVDPHDRQHVQFAFETAVAERLNWAFTCKVHRIDGGVRWIEVSGYPRRTSGKTVTHYIGLVKDVTVQINAAEQRRLLFAELHHRVRNNLAVVRSLIASTFRTSLDVATAVEALSRRVMALSDGHDLLLQASEGPVRIRQIFDAVFARHNASAPEIKIVGPDIDIPLASVTPLSMWLTELLARTPRSRELVLNCGSEGEKNTLSWSELCEQTTWADDLSEILVRNVLPAQMGGAADIDDHGSRFKAVLTLNKSDDPMRQNVSPHAYTATTMLR